MKFSTNTIIAATLAVAATSTITTQTDAFVIGGVCRPAFATSRHIKKTTTTTPPQSSVLRSTIDDTESSTPTESLIKEAMEITKRYGAQSMEARLAWEAAEEVGFDNRYVNFVLFCFIFIRPFVYWLIPRASIMQLLANHYLLHCSIFCPNFFPPKTARPRRDL